MDQVQCSRCKKWVPEGLYCPSCGYRLASGDRNVVRLGTIAGRHPLPVDEYLITRPVIPGQFAYDTVFHAAKDWVKRNGPVGVLIELYYTGLTEALMGALDGFAAAGVERERVILMRFEESFGQYLPLRRHDR
ncbi:MAG: hypothetical protein C4584_01140 [Armatimonadetes bacterium]|nr:MAG: hypothetical protein C4584_01140 [Armatimonadota bacterium]